MTFETTSSKRIRFAGTAIAVWIAVGLVAISCIAIVFWSDTWTDSSRKSTVQYFGGIPIERTKDLICIDANISLQSLSAALAEISKSDQRQVIYIKQPLLPSDRHRSSEESENRDPSALIVAVGYDRGEGKMELTRYHLQVIDSHWVITKKDILVS